MNLNLKEKGILLSKDANGIHNQIKNALTEKGAVVILNQNQDTYYHICFKGVLISALINIVESKYDNNYTPFLRSLYEDNLLANDFRLINIGPKYLLQVEGSVNENKTSNIEEGNKLKGKKFNFKTLSIAFPDINNNFLNNGFTYEISKKIAEDITLAVSGKINLNADQFFLYD